MIAHECQQLGCKRYRVLVRGTQPRPKPGETTPRCPQCGNPLKVLNVLPPHFPRKGDNR
jgi:hypothetical protein